MSLSFPVWLRLTHFINLLFMTLLVRSGLEILSAHPKLYWRDDCLPGSEWLKFTRKKLPQDKLWTSKDEEEPFPSWLALPGRQHLGLGRHWHYLSVIGWMLTGVTYVVLLLATGEWRRLIPTSWSVFPEAWHDFVLYLSFHMPPETGRYNALQQLSYAGVVFLLAPLLILTGAAMSPALTARFPWYLRFFRNRQTARSLHFIVMGLFCVFIFMHVLMVCLHGPGWQLARIVLGHEQASHAWACAIAAVALGGVVAINVWATRDSLAHHPQTILAYEMNGQPLPLEHGAPLRLRVETELGFKMVKYIHSIEFVENVERIGGGLGGYREDHQQYGTGAEI